MAAPPPVKERREKRSITSAREKEEGRKVAWIGCTGKRWLCRDTEEGSCDGEIKGGTNGGRSKRTFPKGEEEILFHRQKKRRLQCLNLKLGKTYIFQLGIQCSLFNPISLLPGHIGPKMEWNGHPGSVRKNGEEVELAQSPMHILQVVAEKGVVGPLAPYAVGMLRAATGDRSG